MHLNETYRFGLTLFTACMLVCAAATLATWIVSTPAQVQDAHASWNCQVARHSGGALFKWYCMPGPIRLAALALWCSVLCLGGVLFVRRLSTDELAGEGWSLLAIRAGLSALIAGAMVFLQFYLIAYVLPYRATETCKVPIWAGIALAAAVASKTMFPKVRPLWLVVPIALASIPGFILITVLLGIEFD